MNVSTNYHHKYFILEWLKSITYLMRVFLPDHQMFPNSVIYGKAFSSVYIYIFVCVCRSGNGTVGGTGVVVSEWFHGDRQLVNSWGP